MRSVLFVDIVTVRRYCVHSLCMLWSEFRNLNGLQVFYITRKSYFRIVFVSFPVNAKISTLVVLIICAHVTPFLDDDFPKNMPSSGISCQCFHRRCCRIPGISDCFLYFNDDFFPVRSLTRQNFVLDSGHMLYFPVSFCDDLGVGLELSSTWLGPHAVL